MFRKSQFGADRLPNAANECKKWPPARCFITFGHCPFLHSASYNRAYHCQIMASSRINLLCACERLPPNRIHPDPLGIYTLIQFSNHSFILFDRFFTNEKFKNQQISENEVLLEFELQRRQCSAFSCPRFGPVTALQMKLAMRLQPVGAQPGLRVHHKL